MKGSVNLSFSYLKEPLIKIFQTDPPYGWIIQSIKDSMKKQEDFLFLTIILFIAQAGYKSM